MTPDVPATLTGLGGLGLGALALRLVQIWLESRRGQPSRAKDASDLIAASAAPFLFHDWRPRWLIPLLPRRGR